MSTSKLKSSAASVTIRTAEISRLDLQDLNTPPTASITDVQQLSSYNWIEASSPTIAVPGSPHLWSPPEGPQQVKKDSGLICIAQNVVRNPDSPLEPLFRALYVENPSYDIRLTDVVTDRNNIRKLISFVNPSSSRDGLEAFTITVEVMENTMIFCRDETETHRFIEAHEFRGFGHEFEKAYTTSHISGSTGHHRIVSYRFGDLKFVVRHETDGYIETNTRTPSSNSKDVQDDSLSKILESLSLSSSKHHLDTIPSGSKLRIRKEGQVVPLESTIEIKTRVFHKPLEIHDIAPQLWISQTPKLIRAYHRRGTFQQPKVEDVAGEIKRWEEVNQRDLRKLATLIIKIRSLVKEFGGCAIVKYDEKRHKLVILKVDGKRMLPHDLYSKWDDEDKSKAGSSADYDTRAESNAENVDVVETNTK